jgi:hypothetical protein
MRRTRIRRSQGDFTPALRMHMYLLIQKISLDLGDETRNLSQMSTDNLREIDLEVPCFTKSSIEAN